MYGLYFRTIYRNVVTYSLIEIKRLGDFYSVVHSIRVIGNTLFALEIYYTHHNLHCTNNKNDYKE